MEELLNKLQNDPIALLVIAALAVVIAFLFLIPAFINYIRSFQIPILKSKDEKSQKSEEPTKVEEKETERETKEVQASEEQQETDKIKTVHSSISKIHISTPTFQKLNFKIGFRFKPSKYLILIVIAIIFLVIDIFAFEYFLRPVRMMDAWQLKLEKGGQLSKLQTGGLGSWPEAKIYMIDVRSNESYEKGHLRGAENLPSYRAAEFYPIEGIPVVVYSSEFSLGDARAVADAIEENGKSGRIKYDKPGKIFVIKDGYEGLKKSGFKIEKGEKN